jgi:4-hydroxybenzoate polyprenyltransferase
VADLSIQRQKDNLIAAAIKSARPVHWIKNLAVFASLLLSGLLLKKGLFIDTLWAFIAFDFATSATYIINDLFDVELDRLHPTKRFRPIASGALPKTLAVIEATILTIIALAISGALSFLFFLIILGYLILQFFYSAGLKNVAILDILIIATGFILRVYAGAFVINAHLSVWFLLCVISIALFLASGKRRSELNLIQQSSYVTRKSLISYKKDLLNSYVTMFGNASWLSWSLYTFFESPRTDTGFWLTLAEISRTATISKLLMFTIPVVIFGIMRYESLIFEGRSEAPEKILLSDKALILAVIIWVIMILLIVYAGTSPNTP